MIQEVIIKERIQLVWDAKQRCDFGQDDNVLVFTVNVSTVRSRTGYLEISQAVKVE